MEESKSLFKTYSSIIWLLCGITVGSILGLVFGKDAIIKPLGDIFFELAFTAIIPLIFYHCVIYR
jgi:Na+/H+-dicarboxylate symporter